MIKYKENHKKQIKWFIMLVRVQRKNNHGCVNAIIESKTWMSLSMVSTDYNYHSANLRSKVLGKKNCYECYALQLNILFLTHWSGWSCQLTVSRSQFANRQLLEMSFAFTDILETKAITTPVVTKKYSLFITKSKFVFLTIRVPSLIAY